MIFFVFDLRALWDISCNGSSHPHRNRKRFPSGNDMLGLWPQIQIGAGLNSLRFETKPIPPKFRGYGLTGKSTLWTQCRSRLKLSENFERHWSIRISGEIHVDQSLVHTFSWGNSYGPMVLKVLLKFPPTLVLVHGWLFPDSPLNLQKGIVRSV